MKRGDTDLSALEQKIMLAVLRQHPSAYGVSIQEHIETATQRRYAFGSIYASLERLEQRGYVKAKEGEPTSERGGRAKLYYTLTGVGRSSLEGALNGLDAMRRGVRWRRAHA